MNLSHLIAELKRRRVFRVAVVYGVVAFAIVQAADIVFPALQLPPWTVTLVVVLALFGFPIALVLAWAFEIVPEGSAGAQEEDAGGGTPVGRGPARSVRRRAAVGGMSILAIVTLALLFLPRLFFAPQPAESADTTDRATERSIAVLPLANLSPDPENEYFADGITEEILTTLSGIAELRVTSRTSTARYKESPKSLAEIARELGVASVVEGSVRRSGDQVRISVQLVDAATDEHLWAGTFERELTTENLFSVQSQIAREIARVLEARLSTTERLRLERRPTENLAAYELYLQGRHHWQRRDREGFQQALTYFRRAIDRDPLYAPAWAGLSDTYDMLADDVGEAGQSREQARAAAERALSLDPDLPEGHSALATVLMNGGAWADAERHFQRAIALKPSYALAHQRHSALLAAMGSIDEAVRAARRAQELDPLSVYARANYGYKLHLAGRSAEAAAELLATRELDPEFGLTYVNLVLVHLEAKRSDRALESARTLHSLWGDQPTALALLGHSLAASGRAEEARELLLRLEGMEGERGVSSFYRAVLLLGMGEKERTIEALGRAVERRTSGLLIYLGVDPLFEPLRSEPGFQALLREMDLTGREGPS